MHKDVYRLILTIFEHTRDFPREHKYALGQDLKRVSIVLVGMTTTRGLRSALSFTMKRQDPQRGTTQGAREAPPAGSLRLLRPVCGCCRAAGSAPFSANKSANMPTISAVCVG